MISLPLEEDEEEDVRVWDGAGRSRGDSGLVLSATETALKVLLDCRDVATLVSDFRTVVETPLCNGFDAVLLWTPIGSTGIFCGFSSLRDLLACTLPLCNSPGGVLLTAVFLGADLVSIVVMSCTLITSGTKADSLLTTMILGGKRVAPSLISIVLGGFSRNKSSSSPFPPITISSGGPMGYAFFDADKVGILIVINLGDDEVTLSCLALSELRSDCLNDDAPSRSARQSTSRWCCIIIFSTEKERSLTHSEE